MPSNHMMHRAAYPLELASTAGQCSAEDIYFMNVSNSIDHGYGGSIRSPEDMGDVLCQFNKALPLRLRFSIYMLTNCAKTCLGSTFTL